MIVIKILVKLDFDAGFFQGKERLNVGKIPRLQAGTVRKNNGPMQVNTDRPSDQGKYFNKKDFQEKLEQAQNHVRKILGTTRNATTDCEHNYDDK